MTSWLGKTWPLRLAMWLSAAALCFVMWPTLAREMRSREWLPSYDRWELDGHTEFGNPILTKIGDKEIEAWDWKTGKRWYFTPPVEARQFVTVIKDNLAYALVALEGGNRLVVIDVATPHERRDHPLSLPPAFAHLVTVDQDLKFALLAPQTHSAVYSAAVVVDVKTGAVVDQKPDFTPAFRVARGDKVFLVGNGELEIVLSASRPNGPLPPVTRWKLTSDGHLVASETPPVVTPEVIEKLRDGPKHIVSPDGHFEVSTVEKSHVDVRDRLTGRLLEKIHVPPAFGLRNVAFSSDSKSLLVGDANTNFQVIDLETQAIIADGHRRDRRVGAIGILTFTSAIGFLAALALSLSTPSFERAAWDFLLATIFWDSLVTVVVLHYAWFPRPYLALAATAAIGIYWAFGKQSFWSRIACGAAGITLLCGGCWWVSARTIEFQADRSNFLTLLMIVPTAVAISAWFKTLFGWRIAQQNVAASLPRRFQFGMGTILVIVAVTGLVLRMVRELFGELLQIGNISTFMVLAIVLLIYFALVVAVTWLFLWVWFRDFDMLTILLSLLIFAAILSPAFLRLYFTEDKDFSLSSMAQGFFVYAAPWICNVAAFSFPLWLARRHGYRWVKANRPTPDVDSAIGASG
jgi:hypothetical protein